MGIGKFIVGEVLDPVTRRLGTAVAAYLVALGVEAQTVDAITLGITAAAGLGIDLLLSHLSRKAKS